MNRRDFMMSGALAVAAPWLGSTVARAESVQSGGRESTVPAPFLRLPMPPLEHRGNVDVRTIVHSAQTGGVYSCVEIAVAPKRMGPTPHAHKDLDELMYVLEGSASVLMDEEVLTVPEGGWHLRPRRIKHTFFNASERPLRFIDMYFNQPFEDYLEQTFHQLTPENGWPLDSEKRRAEIARLTEKFGLIRFAEGPSQRTALMQRYGLM